MVRRARRLASNVGEILRQHARSRRPFLEAASTLCSQWSMALAAAVETFASSCQDDPAAAPNTEGGGGRAGARGSSPAAPRAADGRPAAREGGDDAVTSADVSALLARGGRTPSPRHACT